MPNSIISLPAAISIGIGGMIGAGIFSILGVVAQAAGNAMWLSFLIGGVVALFCIYSYAKLGAAFPTAGGAVEFLVRGWGKGNLSGGMNLFMWIGYILSIALYAQGFTVYFMTFFPHLTTPLFSKSIAVGVVILFTFVNMLGAGTMGKAETLIVAIKVGILVLFSVVGLFFVEAENLSPSHWPSTANIFFGASVLFIGYEGFGLVANAAANMKNPKKTLPIALYLSMLIVIVIYIAVSITVVGNLSVTEISVSGDYALAAAAKPFLGHAGFVLIAVAALFSTSSAINATLFGSANICYQTARDGELPQFFARGGSRMSLYLTTLLTIVFILFFDLASVAMMGSGAFLLIYIAVNAGHLKIVAQTGAKKSLVWISLLLCLILFVILEIYTYQTTPAAVYTMLILLAGCFIADALFRKFQHNGRHAKSNP